MRKRMNIVCMLGAAGLLWVLSGSVGCLAADEDPLAAVRKEKETLQERLRSAQMESDILAFQRKQLDIEQREILKQQKMLAEKERQLLSHPTRETIQRRLEAQNTLLAQARRQLDQARQNVALQIETLQAELARQELERKSFTSKYEVLDLKKKQQDRADVSRCREETRQRVQERKDAAIREREAARRERIEKEQKEQERRVQIVREQRKEREEQAARKRQETQDRADAARKERELVRSQRLEKEREARECKERRDREIRMQKEKETALQKELDACRQSLSAIAQENDGAQQRSIQGRLDRLLERQRALLDAGRKVENDLSHQQKNIRELLEKAQSTTSSEAAQ